MFFLGEQEQEMKVGVGWGWKDRQKEKGGKAGGRLLVFVPQCHLDYGSQEDGNQTGDILPEVGTAALLLHLLGE